MARSTKIRFKGKPSEILDSIEFEGYTIKSLRHGVTGHVLYCYPSAEYEWEDCWGTDLEIAKKSVLKFKEAQQVQSIQT